MPIHAKERGYQQFLEDSKGNLKTVTPNPYPLGSREFWQYGAGRARALADFIVARARARAVQSEGT